LINDRESETTMSIQQYRLATIIAVTVAITGGATFFVRQQKAQSSKQTEGPRVLIEKNQIIDDSRRPQTTIIAPDPILANDAEGSRPVSFASAIQGFDRNVVKGAPFSAQLEIETVWPRRDGTKTTLRSIYMFYRDNEGRTRRDLMTQQRVSEANGSTRPRVSLVNDPVAGVAYVFEHVDGTARKMSVQASTPDLEKPARGSAANSQTRGSSLSFRMLEPQRGLSRLISEQPAPPVQTRKELLGKREIDGLTAEGMRILEDTLVGGFGTEKRIEIATEEWYSRELQTVVLIKLFDPRYGQNEYRLANINRSEPAATLFTVPTGYKVKEERPPK
jgi:hypothetical protein